MNILPKKVLIFGRWFKISIEEISDEVLGDCDYEKEQIRISPKQTNKRRTHTFLHEFIHAVLFRVGIYQGLDDKFNEAISESIATALLENFKITIRNKRK